MLSDPAPTVVNTHRRENPSARNISHTNFKMRALSTSEQNQTPRLTFCLFWYVEEFQYITTALHWILQELWLAGTRYRYNFDNCGHYPSSCILFKTQLNSVPHKKHITSPLRAQQVNAIYSIHQSVSKSWCRAQSGTFDQRSFFSFFFKVTVLSFGGALSDERSGLSFISPCQYSLEWSVPHRKHISQELWPLDHRGGRKG
jgi:hypothetical protein